MSEPVFSLGSELPFKHTCYLTLSLDFCVFWGRVIVLMTPIPFTWVLSCSLRLFPIPFHSVQACCPTLDSQSHDLQRSMGYWQICCKQRPEKGLFDWAPHHGKDMPELDCWTIGYAKLIQATSILHKQGHPPSAGSQTDQQPKHASMCC